jgi:tetratricopeptide (TPR) repeat protein
MRAARVLFGDSHYITSTPHPVIFLQDHILTYFRGFSWEGSGNVGPGQFVLVLYGVGHVGGGYYAVDRLYAFDLPLQEAINLPTGHDPEVVDALLRLAGHSVQLSEGQRSELITHIKGWRSYEWDNAARDVKEMLTGREEEVPDRARRLLREATATWDGSEEQERPCALIREALILYPALPNAHFELARMAIVRGDVADAIRQCEAELSEAEEPDALNAHSYLSLIYAAKGDHESSRRHAQAAMAVPTAVPTQLLPEVARKIRNAVDRERTK